MGASNFTEEKDIYCMTFLLTGLLKCLQLKYKLNNFNILNIPLKPKLFPEELLLNIKDILYVAFLLTRFFSCVMRQSCNKG